jgi:hypothetical protein
MCPLIFAKLQTIQPTVKFLRRKNRANERRSARSEEILDRSAT